MGKHIQEELESFVKGGAYIYFLGPFWSTSSIVECFGLCIMDEGSIDLPFFLPCNMGQVV